MNPATQPARQPAPMPAPRSLAIALVSAPVCDGCRTTAAPGGWHQGDDGVQLCPACWRDCELAVAGDGSRP